MKVLWSRREIDAKPDMVWELLTDVEQWSVWGPMVRHVEVAGNELELGTTGKVTTSVGVVLDFEINAFSAGKRWAWDVAGVPATDHVLEPLGSDRCRAAFGIGWPAAPYLVLCMLALRRLEEIATAKGPAS